MQAWGDGAAGATVSPSPPISGREISALAVVRREPSWSYRSLQRCESGAAQVVGYSVSPVQVTAWPAMLPVILTGSRDRQGSDLQS